MKLFIYDEKHEAVHGEIDLELFREDKKDLSARVLLQSVIDFLDKQGLTDRYKRLVLAEGYTITTDENSGENEVEWHGWYYGVKLSESDAPIVQNRGLISP